MDRGDTLGFVPDPYPEDLKAYDTEMKRLGVEWVAIEAFRVFDQWVADHVHGRGCGCLGVAGTVDRIGWMRGRLRIFDIKTSHKEFNKLGQAQQLSMYARMVPYLYPGDTRGEDVDQVDLDVGYIIKLPEGQGHCEMVPRDIAKGWQANLIAKAVWETRAWKVDVERDHHAEVTEMAMRASTVEECRLLWENALELGVLDNRVKTVIRARAAELKRMTA
jgi:hypothetical protein